MPPILQVPASSADALRPVCLHRSCRRFHGSGFSCSPTLAAVDGHHWPRCRILYRPLISGPRAPNLVGKRWRHLVVSRWTGAYTPPWPPSSRRTGPRIRTLCAIPRRLGGQHPDILVPRSTSRSAALVSATLDSRPASQIRGAMSCLPVRAIAWRPSGSATAFTTREQRRRRSSLPCQSLTCCRLACSRKPATCLATADEPNAVMATGSSSSPWPIELGPPRTPCHHVT